MQVNSATSNVANAAADPTGSTTDTATNPASTLTQADFLQLLVAQMQNQDPMNPQSDTDMAAQMAQFSSLTESTNMSNSLSMMQANSLVGSTVNLQLDSSTTATGVVQGVVMNNGNPEILVNGSTYPLNEIVSVEPPVSATGNAATPPSGSGNLQN
jgi:flagellar basal-body rod modification protein FlgD